MTVYCFWLGMHSKVGGVNINAKKNNFLFKAAWQKLKHS
jgi:hypothetical protein